MSWAFEEYDDKDFSKLQILENVVCLEKGIIPFSFLKDTKINDVLNSMTEENERTAKRCYRKLARKAKRKTKNEYYYSSKRWIAHFVRKLIDQEAREMLKTRKKT